MAGIEMNSLLDFVMAAGGLGTAAMGVVEGLKATWIRPMGFSKLENGPRRFTSERRGAGKVVSKTRHDIAGNAISIVIEDHNVNHGDYLPPDNIKKQNNKKQNAAENLAIAALADEKELSYSLPD